MARDQLVKSQAGQGSDHPETGTMEREQERCANGFRYTAMQMTISVASQEAVIVGAIFAIRGGMSSSVSCFRSNVSATIDRQGTTVVCVMASAPTLSRELCMMQQWAGSSPP